MLQRVFYFIVFFHIFLNFLLNYLKLINIFNLNRNKINF